MTGGSSKAGVKTNDRLSVKHKKGKKLKDPNRPKRPSGPFLVFMEEFRMELKQNNPTVKGGAAMGKAGGDKWKSMSNDDKAKFVTIAEQRKKDYEKKMKAYETKLVDPSNVRPLQEGAVDTILEAEKEAEATKLALKRKISQAASADTDFQSRSLPAKLRIEPEDSEDVCVPTLHSENSFHSSKSCNYSSKVAGQSLESDPNYVPSTNDKVVKDCRQGSSAVEDVPSEKAGKELHTGDDTTTSKIDSIKKFVEVVPNATRSGHPVHTSSTLHDSPNNSHQTPKSIATETVGFFNQLEDMLHGNKPDWVLPPQIQLDEQTIGDYEQLLKKGLSGDLKDLFKDSTYQEFKEALTGLLACRRIPSNLHQGFFTLSRDLPSLASRVSELNKEISQSMLHQVKRSTMKELESCLHKYRKCEEHLVKLEQEKEQNVSEINRLKARNEVIDSEIATYTEETDALQKASATQSLKMANLDAPGSLDESTLQRSLDDLAIMENDWRKRVDMLDF